MSSYIRAAARHPNAGPPADEAVLDASRVRWIRLRSVRSLLHEAQPGRIPLFSAPRLFPSYTSGLQDSLLFSMAVARLLQFALQLDAGALLFSLLLALETVRLSAFQAETKSASSRLTVTRRCQYAAEA